MLTSLNQKMLRQIFTGDNERLMSQMSVLSLCLDVRNAGQLECPLIHFRLVDRLETIMRIVLSVPLAHIGASVTSIGPVSSPNPAFIRILLSD